MHRWYALMKYSLLALPVFYLNVKFFSPYNTPRPPLSVHKKFQPNRSSRLAGYMQHIYIRMSCFIIKIISLFYYIDYQLVLLYRLSACLTFSHSQIFPILNFELFPNWELSPNLSRLTFSHIISVNNSYINFPFG